MATIAVQKVTEAGLEATYSNSDTDNGDKCLNNNGDVCLHLKNGGANEAVVTIAAQTTSRFVPGFGTLVKEDLVLTIPAGEERFAGPFLNGAWSDSAGLLNWAYSGDGAADVDVAALRFGDE